MSSERRILTPEERRQRNREETIANILQAAREVMREQGVADLNLQQVAQKVGMRAPSLYNYFPNRIALYETLFVLGMRMYRQQLEELVQTYGTSWEGLQRIMERHLAFALENPELYQLLFERPVPGFVPSPEGLEESAQLLETSTRMTQQAIAEGTFHTALSPEVAMNLLIAMMHGITAQHLANEPHLPSGSGRFGSLIPIILDLLQKAWSQDRSTKS